MTDPDDAPQAKVVLVNRDIEKWERSFTDTVITSFSDWKTWVIINLIEPFQTVKMATLTKAVLLGLFDAHDEESWRRNLRKKYLEHAAKMRERVPKDHLLEYELGSGWGPLCSFLGKEIPNKPFPHLNETKDFDVFLNGFKNEKLMLGFWFVLRSVAILAVLTGVATCLKLI